MSMNIINAIVELLMLCTVWANTETIRFVYNSDNGNSPVEHSTISETCKSVIHTVIPQPRGIESEQWIKIDGRDNQPYEVRVCWPASMPTEFDMEYVEGYIRIGYKTQYFSHMTDLMDHPLPVQFEVVLNRLVYGALPSDIVDTIGLAVVGGLFAFYYLSKLPFSYGLI